MIVVVPMAGLANRLRVIDSAIMLSKEINKEVEVYWSVNPGELNCKFEYLFKDLNGVIVKSFNLLLPDTYPSYIPLFAKSRLNRYFVTNKFDYLINNSNISKIKVDTNRFLEQVRQFDKIYVRTWDRFLPGKNMEEIFTPIESIKLRVQSYQTMYSQSYSGFHIRRNDNVWSSNRSPLDLFEKYIRHEIEIGNNVFLATDELEVEKILIKKFGKNIFFTKKSLTRNSIKGMQDALVDFLLLADSNVIYGSYWSSFSEEAASYKSKPLITVSSNTN